MMGDEMVQILPRLQLVYIVLFSLFRPYLYHIKHSETHVRDENMVYSFFGLVLVQFLK